MRTGTMNHNTSNQTIWYFGRNRTDNVAADKQRLGFKGISLLEMTDFGLPVPPGFIISTNVCEAYHESQSHLPGNLMCDLKDYVAVLEAELGKEFGSESNPLLLSVRSSPAISMPGLMNTILNVGLNDASTAGLARETGNVRFGYDAYRRLISMFGEVVMDIDLEHFDIALDAIKSKYGAMDEYELHDQAMRDLCDSYKEVYLCHTGSEFPQDPLEQLEQVIAVVFRRWNSSQAISYREIKGIRGLIGTAAICQSMVFGNLGHDSAVGVAFTRNPSTGENKMFGEFLVNAQGEDVWLGIQTPQSVAAMKEWNERAFFELMAAKNSLERYYKDMMDFEFTIEKSRLWLLGVRRGKRTPSAALRIAMDRFDDGAISKRDLVFSLSLSDLLGILKPRRISEQLLIEPITRGLPASPGAIAGRVVFNVEAAKEAAKTSDGIIFVRHEVSPEDVEGISLSQGVLTTRGGITSHAALACREWGVPCVAGAGEITIHPKARQLVIGETVVREFEALTIDGTTGEVFIGRLDTSSVDVNSDPLLSRYAILVRDFEANEYDAMLGTLWSLRDALNGVVVPFGRDPVWSNRPKPDSTNSDFQSFKSFVSPTKDLVRRVVESCHTKISDDTCAVTWGLLHHFLILLQNEVGIGSHPDAIRPLNDPFATEIDAYDAFLVDPKDYSLQLLGVEFFGINHWLRLYLDCAIIQWCAVVRVPKGQRGWRIDSTNPKGESLCVGSGDLVGLSFSLNGRLLSIAETRAFYHDIRRRNSLGWSEFSETKISWREVYDLTVEVRLGHLLSQRKQTLLQKLRLIDESCKLTQVGESLVARISLESRRHFSFLNEELAND